MVSTTAKGLWESLPTPAFSNLQNAGEIAFYSVPGGLLLANI